MCSQYILISILSQRPPFWAPPLTDQAFLTLVQPLHLGVRVPDLGKGLTHCLGKNINMWSYVSVCVCVCLCVSVRVCVNVCISISCILSETVEGKSPWNEGPPPLRGPWWFLLVWEISGQHWRGNIEPPLEGLDIPSTGNSCNMPVAPGHVRQWHTCNWNILGAGGPIGHAEMWNDG